MFSWDQIFGRINVYVLIRACFCVNSSLMFSVMTFLIFFVGSSISWYLLCLFCVKSSSKYLFFYLLRTLSSTTGSNSLEINVELTIKNTGIAYTNKRSQKIDYFCRMLPVVFFRDELFLKNNSTSLYQKEKSNFVIPNTTRIVKSHLNFQNFRGIFSESYLMKICRNCKGSQKWKYCWTTDTQNYN